VVRILAVDPGTARCGLALCDGLGIVASPAGVIEVRDGRDLPRRLAERAAGEGAGLILIGHPLNADGTEGPRALAAARLADAVAAATSIPVELMDERYTTIEAEELLAEAGRRRRDRRGRKDEAAAAVLLRRYLDTHPRGEP
jgi:putative Holliday junction resolvase